MMLEIFAAVAAVAILGTALAVRLGGVFGWILAVVAGLVALVAVASFAAVIWGRYVGMPWLFTP